MEQTNLFMTVENTQAVAERYHREIVSVLQHSGLNYDLDPVKTDHRTPLKSQAYDAIMMFNVTCFRIKGIKKLYLEMNQIFARLYRSAGYSFEEATSNRWARISVDEFGGFFQLAELIGELYEACLRDADTFGCCSCYEQCSDARVCIKKDIMFAGKCAYRQSLKAGKIFYGKNRNV